MNSHISSADCLVKLYKALAHPVRLHLLHLLLHQEACVCHLTCVMRRPQPYISQQLGKLRDAGLVTDRRDGQTVYYQVANPDIAVLLTLGQQILRDQGVECELPAAESAPIPGCSCPKCDSESERS
jgi:DNA-binding transcriptional ArsR family regulator